MEALEKFVINRFTEIIFGMAIFWIVLVAYGMMMS
jgi:hypothetical protein